MTETVALQLREAWLNEATRLLAPMFEEHVYMIPQVRVICGWPSQNARPSKRQRLGECWAGVIAEDGVPQIFITPMLADSTKTLAVLVHELVHAAVGTECGHKGEFVRLARKLGLEGPPTATHAGTELEKRLDALVAQLGPYPHSKLNVGLREKKQSTRLIKAACPDCTCIIRITRKWIDDAPFLACPIPECGGTLEVG